eukprot:Clim_evm72s108 gene=Clim_evmTU72s108
MVTAASQHDGRVYHPNKDSTAKGWVHSMKEYQELYDQSINDPDAFWSKIAERFYWKQKWENLKDVNFSRKAGPVSIKWFVGAKTNVCYNCVDRHVLYGLGDRTALIFEGNDPTDDAKMSYGQLYAEVQKFANVLKSLGVKKGDCVAIYLPMIFELPVAMLACARIGAVHSIVFGGFSAEALGARLVDAGCDVLITADGTFRGKKCVPLKKIADEACDIAARKGQTVRTCVVVRRLGDKCPDGIYDFHEGRDQLWSELMTKADPECECEWMDAEDPLFMLYTSGSTGKPKGALHTTAGYMVWAATTFRYTFSYHENDIYWCTADLGWITGHSYITYGPLANAATSIVFEGIPTYPDPGRLWQVCEKYKVNQFYTAPTAIRALMKFGDEYVNRCNLSSLQVLGTVGEPINPEAWRWYYSVVGGGKCPVVDTWWQTETGGHMLTPLPGVTPLKAGSATLPMFGVIPAVIDKDSGKEIDGPGDGFLVIKNSWPGQMRTVYGDHQRFEATYFSQFDGYYFTGDGCQRDEDGYYWITGRVDDVLNVSGHRIGTAELEAALTSTPKVSEAAVVGFPHDVKGEGIYAYVILSDGHDGSSELEQELKQVIRKDIGPFATPDYFQFVPGLPKTRSGKIMRRILRKIAHHEEDQLGDTSTLADPDVVNVLIEGRRQ